MLSNFGEHFIFNYFIFMVMKHLIKLTIFMFIFVMNCNKNDSDSLQNNSFQPSTFKILALGDSYTIGESVCETCRFPEQLKDSLKQTIELTDTIDLKVIARTGWTTTNLINAIYNDNPVTDYDLVTLLIGVNNQYQNKPFSLYEEEFPLLVQEAIRFAKGDKTNVIVVSIPDYAFTPFGQTRPNPENISTQLDQYNAFAQNYCEENGITFINITDITREGLNNPELVAADGLHPSEVAYTQFVQRLKPIASEKIQ